jgi:hypothetical protein
MEKNANIVNKYELIRDASNVEVVVSEKMDDKNIPRPVATLLVGEYVHQFDHNSRINKALETMTTDDLTKRLKGGQFFFINDKLIDFRDGQYDGFVHSDDNVHSLMEHIGVRAQTKSDRFGNRSTTTAGSGIVLSNRWNQQDIHVQGYQEGGAFTSNLHYDWNPFHQHVRGVFELVRLICANGMIGSSDIFNARIPVVNRWEEHLEIASRQIQNKVNDSVSKRLYQMGNERASVAELQLIAAHAENRMLEMNIRDYGSVDSFEEARTSLRNINSITNPEIHLIGHYNESVFEDKNLTAQIAGHLSLFDAWNLVTEMFSHTKEVQKSSNAGLQKMANSLVFDGAKRNARLNRTDVTAPIMSSFSDPEVAFFGQVS